MFAIKAYRNKYKYTNENMYKLKYHRSDIRRGGDNARGEGEGGRGGERGGEGRGERGEGGDGETGRDE